MTTKTDIATKPSRLRERESEFEDNEKSSFECQAINIIFVRQGEFLFRMLYYLSFSVKLTASIPVTVFSFI